MTFPPNLSFIRQIHKNISLYSKTKNPSLCYSVYIKVYFPVSQLYCHSRKNSPVYPEASRAPRLITAGVCCPQRQNH